MSRSRSRGAMLRVYVSLAALCGAVVGVGALPASAAGSASTTTVSTLGVATMVLGASNVDQATVTGSMPNVDPTGSVYFYECGPALSASSCGAKSVIDKVSLSGGANPASVVSTPFKPTAKGYWCFVALYTGDATYGTSNDKSLDGCFYVAPMTVKPIITTATSSTWLDGASGSFHFAAEAAAPVTFTEKGTLPSGLKLSSAGLLSGTPHKSGSFKLAVTAHSSSHVSWTQNFLLTVAPGCTATVTKGVVVGATTPTTVHVSSVPTCFLPSSSSGGPAELVGALVNAKSSSHTSLVITGGTTIAVNTGAIINFRPIIQGTVTCTGVTGEITFSPALRNNESSFPKESISAQATCTVSRAGATAAARSDGVSPRECDWCGWVLVGLVVVGEGYIIYQSGGLATQSMVAVSTSGLGIAFPGNQPPGPTQGNLPDDHFVTGPAGKLELVATGPLAPSLRGAFADGDNGASSSVAFLTNQTPAEINKLGGTTGGIKSIKIVSGTLHLG